MFKRYAHVRSSFVNKLIALDNELQKEIQKSWQYTMEPLVVAAEPLGRILREFCKEWVNQYPKGRFNFNSYYYGPQDFIAEKTGFEIRQIGRICNSEKQFVALSQADAILTVIGNSDFTTNGVIQVIVNPTWSLEAYMAYMKERGCI
jgi:murein L,D-transpeptidase YafK